MSFLFGAGMGLLFGGPLGAVVGGAIEHMMTGNRQGGVRPNYSAPPNQEAVFVANLTAIAAKISLADGHISQQERRVIHDFFAKNLHFHGQELLFIDRLIEETKIHNPDLREICASFKQTSQYEQRLLLFDLAYQIAMADEIITPDEQAGLNRVAEYTGVREEDAERIRRKYAISSKKDNYAVLGLSRNASVREIKNAYKQLASQYHPDKVSHLGEELIRFAEQKFSEINGAYHDIRRSRAF